MRKAVTTLQSVFTLYNGQITEEAVVEVAGVLPSYLMDQLWDAIQSNIFDRIEVLYTHINTKIIVLLFYFICFYSL